MMSVRVITAPKIYVLGRPQIDFSELSRFLSEEGHPGWMTDTDNPAQMLVELSGRTCYQSFKSPRPGGNQAYIDHIREAGHGSVLENAVWSFLVTGVSRTLTHELVRHRHMSYSQLSQRYVDESDVAFVVPPALLAGQEPAQGELADAYQSWKLGCALALDSYHHVLALLESHFQGDKSLRKALRCSLGKDGSQEDLTARRKAAREAARAVLPNATETKIFLTANARALRGFLEQRGSRYADAEIRRLSLEFLKVLQREAPHLFSDYRVEDFQGGPREIVTEHRKV